MTRVIRLCSLAVLLGLVVAAPAAGQIPSLKKLKDKVKKVSDGTGTEGKAEATAAAGKAGEVAKVWDNYDFVPGNKVLFYTDFSGDKVGNFASRLKYVNGPMDVVERNGARVLRATGPATFLIPLAQPLPDKFTLEFDVIPPAKACCLFGVITFEGGAARERSPSSADVMWTPRGASIAGGGQEMNASVSKIPEEIEQSLWGQLVHVRVLMDGEYFKMYSDDRRLYNIPELGFRRDKVIRVYLEGNPEPGFTVYIAGIRVAESDTDVLWDALAAKGRWSTLGILFATAKAALQPESRPVVREIADALKAHPDLKILIEGHTDNVGDPASNLTLSQARADAVKAALVSQFGADGGRITTQGFGDTKPVADNATAEGRAQNRRVEIVKQ
jgi:OmpA-OmpF porin, OOP family